MYIVDVTSELKVACRTDIRPDFTSFDSLPSSLALVNTSARIFTTAVACVLYSALWILSGPGERLSHTAGARTYRILQFP